MTTTQRFEDRLLHELQAVVQTRSPVLADAPAPHHLRKRLSIGGAIAATTGVALIAFTGGGASPAYAVESHDGSVTVTIKSLRDAEGLQKALRAHGVPAIVDYAPEGKACRQPRGHAPSQSSQHGGASRMAVGSQMSVDASGAATFTISLGQFGPGQSLVIESSVGQALSSIGIAVVEGTVAPCELVDAPAPSAQRAGGDTGPSLTTSNGDSGPSTSTKAG